MQPKQIPTPSEKSAICVGILHALPRWFGIPESTQEYIQGVADKPFYAVLSQDDTPVGFAAITPHNPFTAEIYVMGILQSHHRQGIGRQLIMACESYCRSQNMEFLTVKTLSESHPDPFYKQTRLFYEAMGFRPLEVFPTLWDECNPCLFLAKYVKETT
jgi:GNAT superfamily N-acetyltransferase